MLSCSRILCLGWVISAMHFLHDRVPVWRNKCHPTKFQRSDFSANSGTSVEKVKMSPTNANGKDFDQNIFRTTWHTASPFWAASRCREALSELPALRLLLLTWWDSLWLIQVVPQQWMVRRRLRCAKKTNLELTCPCCSAPACCRPRRTHATAQSCCP